MPLLDGVTGPQDLRKLTPDELRRLAEEIRAFLVTNVSRTGAAHRTVEPEAGIG